MKRNQFKNSQDRKKNKIAKKNKKMMKNRPNKKKVKPISLINSRKKNKSKTGKMIMAIMSKIKVTFQLNK